ncbi:MAG: hypothetical protein JRG81_10420 [Deltaproteobacteria bacterium]|nr:hypothetical protein [Deltaproteobacteria bacterium]
MTDKTCEECQFFMEHDDDTLAKRDNGQKDGMCLNNTLVVKQDNIDHSVSWEVNYSDTCDKWESN